MSPRVNIVLRMARFLSSHWRGMASPLSPIHPGRGEANPLCTRIRVDVSSLFCLPPLMRGAGRSIQKNTLILEDSHHRRGGERQRQREREIGRETETETEDRDRDG